MTKMFFYAILVACMFSAGTSTADEFHYTDLLIGDRASGMGGAYTAVSDDATGLYYNPAGIVYSAGRGVSASVNAFSATDKTYKNVVDGHDWRRTSSALLPNYFGVIQPLRNGMTIGISYAAPESMTVNQGQTFTDLSLGSDVAPHNPDARISSYLINFNEESNTLNFGPSIATELDNNLTAGLTLYYYQRKKQIILNQLIKTTNGGYEWTNNYLRATEKGIRPVLGFLWLPVRNVSVGLAVSKIILNSSDTVFQNTYRRQGIAFPVDTDGDGIIDSTISDEASLPDGQSSTSAKRTFPTQVNIGVAWYPSTSVLFSADVNYFTKVRGRGVEQVANVAVGTEYDLSSAWTMRAGMYTNFANTPSVNSGGVNQNEHIDLYGLTASISRFIQIMSVTLGAGYTFGEGKSQIIRNSDSIQDAESKGWTVFLSVSYSY